MSTTTFTEKDIQQMAELGLTEAMVSEQMSHYKNGFKRLLLDRAATIDNGGITPLSDKEIAARLTKYDEGKEKLTIEKFVPASGAASRMFKDLFAFSSTYYGVAYNFGKEYPTVKEFLENIHSFAFFDDLKNIMAKSQLDIEEYLSRGDYSTIINFLLGKHHMNYSTMPKALLKFHRYGEIERTPLEEHIVEGAEYAKNADGTVRLHFTVSSEHRTLFQKKIRQIKNYYEEALGIKLIITLSEQSHSTDTIAVDEYNNPLRDEDGNLIFRPGGHGALIKNLEKCKGDIVMIKNIDNVVPDWEKHTTIVYKKVLAGMLMEIQERVHGYMRALSVGKVDEKMLDEIEDYATTTLHLALPYHNGSDKQCRVKGLIALLDRPIRVCGMVKNNGEPGGGPFWVKEDNGELSLQIVETAQVNRKEPEQEKILESATHFNPVDIVCGMKDYRGRRYKLEKYVDGETGFISKKSHGALTIKSQELPGLWNGAMAKWVTIFVEVPTATFNPVKTVNDLLRQEHREGIR